MFFEPDTPPFREGDDLNTWRDMYSPTFPWDAEQSLPSPTPESSTAGRFGTLAIPEDYIDAIYDLHHTRNCELCHRLEYEGHRLTRVTVRNQSYEIAGPIQPGTFDCLAFVRHWELALYYLNVNPHRYPICFFHRLTPKVRCSLVRQRGINSRWVTYSELSRAVAELESVARAVIRPAPVHVVPANMRKEWVVDKKTHAPKVMLLQSNDYRIPVSWLRQFHQGDCLLCSVLNRYYTDLPNQQRLEPIYEFITRWETLALQPDTFFRPNHVPHCFYYRLLPELRDALAVNDGIGPHSGYQEIKRAALIYAATAL
jgi:hypothetical protein